MNDRRPWGRIDRLGQVVLDDDGLLEALLRGHDPTCLVVEDEVARKWTEASGERHGFRRPHDDEAPEGWFEARAGTFFDPVPTFDEIFDALLDMETDPERRGRLETERELFRQHGLEGLVRAAWRITEAAHSSGVVLGPGRGSACASLALYLMGFHMVDPLENDVPLTDLFRDGV